MAGLSSSPFRAALVGALAVVALIVFVSASRPDSPPLPRAGDDKTVPVETKAGLRFAVPATWKVQPPSSQMRQAQAAIPKSEGDPEDGELVVFHFGAGQGGTVEENLKRWYAQFEGPDGKPPESSAKVENKKVGGLAVTTVDVSGKYVAPIKIGSPEKNNKPNFRMLGAIVETPGGSFYFKLVGPAKTVQENAKGFAAAIESVKFEAPKR